jgi:hypothetical protein
MTRYGQKTAIKAGGLEQLLLDGDTLIFPLVVSFNVLLHINFFFKYGTIFTNKWQKERAV